MASRTLDALIWGLLYAGALLAVLGFWALASAPALGAPLVAIGALVVACGVVLLGMRARRGEDGPP